MIALYLAHLHQHGKKHGTLLSHSSAIGFVHKISGHADPTNSFLITKMLSGAKHTSHETNNLSEALLPITNNILQQLIAAIPYCNNTVYGRAMIKALFLLAHGACLRAGEIVLSDNSSHCLQIHQIIPIAENGLICAFKIQFSTYKHHNYKTPTLILRSSHDKTLCPVFALHQYLQLRYPTPGPLFLTERGHPLTRIQFSSLLKQCATMCGLPAYRYNTHSFRIGKVTQMAHDNVSDLNIRQIGRWSSDAFRRYIRPQQIHA